MKDDLGDRMKGYERFRTLTKFEDKAPFVYARIDGRGFSKFTRGMQKPFDNSLKNLMVSVTESLVKKTHAIAGYTQSDEISLVWDRDKIFFDGKIQKITSVLAALTTSTFVIEGLESTHAEKIAARFPHFDARAFELPDADEVTNAFLWRYNDCNRNAIQSIGQANFSQKQLNGKSIKDLRTMLASIGIFEGDFPQDSIHGTFVKRVSVLKKNDLGLFSRDVLRRTSLAFSKIDHTERKALIFSNED